MLLSFPSSPLRILSYIGKGEASSTASIDTLTQSRSSSRLLAIFLPLLHQKGPSMDSSAGRDAGVGPSSSVAKVPGAGTSSSSAPTDPFIYLVQHIHQCVAISLLPADDKDDGAVVRGTLLSVDDLCNVMVQHWSSTDAMKLDCSAGNGRQPPQQQQPRKRARLDAVSGGDVEESVRLIRGAQIVSISLLPT
ncbi:hypothetical protein Q4I30_004231 [Leishmania utingensis]